MGRNTETIAIETAVIEIAETGGADRLYETTRTLPAPGPGEVRIRQSHAGVNFVDIYQREGSYPLPEWPAVPGVEGVGIVEATGPETTGIAPGTRAAWAGFPAGGYVTARNISASRLIPIPDTLDDAQIAGSFLRGLTAHMLLTRVARLHEGETVLIHAAAGGLGLILTQWAKRLGATTIGTVGTPEKEKTALAHGLDHAIRYRETDFVGAVKDITDGRGVDFAVDGIGAETLVRTLDSLAPFGIAANVGQVAGPVPPVEMRTLANRFLIQPSVLAFIANETAYREAAAGWFAMLEGGLSLPPAHEYALAEATAAHADMEAGRTGGPVRLRMP